MNVFIRGALAMASLTIALFYAFGTLFGGVGGPWLFGVLIAGGSSGEIMWGYMLGAVLMIAAALVTLRWRHLSPAGSVSS